MHAPQIIMICLLFYGTVEAMGKHGEPKTGNHNFFATVIAVIFNLAILWWGGFWR